MIYLFMKRTDWALSLQIQYIEAPDHSHYRVIDMYTACTHPTVKKQVLDDFVPRTQSYE